MALRFYVAVSRFLTSHFRGKRFPKNNNDSKLLFSIMADNAKFWHIITPEINRAVQRATNSPPHLTLSNPNANIGKFNA